MYKKIYSILWLIPAILLFSCSEDVPVADDSGDDSRIVFQISMPSAQSRSTGTTVAANLLTDGFYVTAFCPENNVSGVFNPNFAEQYARPLEDKPGYFAMFDQSSEMLEWPSIRHDKEGKLKFFAFYPSRDALRQSAGVDAASGYFGLTNASSKNGSTVTYDYKITKFKLNHDISRHIDFVTAAVEGTRRANGDTGVKLAFEHQLSRIDLKAWGNTVNDIEIAGVRIGGVITESDFNFAKKPKNLANGDATLDGDWVGTSTKGTVEYIFREGDEVIKVGNGSHTSKANAASIMGNGGYAMVIPANYTAKWDHAKDPFNSKQGLYFSVLLRVKENDENRTLLYPYIEGVQYAGTVTTDIMNVVYFSIEKATGKIKRRVYRNKTTKLFYTSPDLTGEPYTAPADEEIRNYGWAAIPFTRLWKPGYQYTYTLDYSAGVGVHDPGEPSPYPGKPIISKIMVQVTEGTNKWPMVVGDFTPAESVDVKVTIE